MSKELGKLIRAARALLGWHQADLAKQSKVSTPTIWAIETGKTVEKVRKGEGRVPNELTIDALKAAMEEGGVGFDDPIKGVRGPGVYLKWREDMADDNAGTVPGGAGPTEVMSETFDASPDTSS